MTFSIVEVAQYAAFASARAYSLAHKDETTQIEKAKTKFQEIVGAPGIAPFFNNGWFEITDVEVGDFNDEFPGGDASIGADTFVGARAVFSAPILYKRIPLIGTTASDPDGFEATVQSFLAVEPTFNECRDFMNSRAQNLGALEGTYGSAMSAENIVILMDNGC